MTWTPLTKVDAADLRSQALSPPEAGFATGVSGPRLLTWHSENLVPEPRDLTGRGFRRKYNVAQLAHLIAMRVLSDHGVPLSDHHKPLDATAYLVNILAEAILHAFDTACEAASAEAAMASLPQTIVIAALGDGTYTFGMFWLGRDVSSMDVSSMDEPEGPNTMHWMHSKGFADAIIIVPMELGCALRTAIEDIVANRGTPLLRKKLTDHQARFKRRPAQKKKPVPPKRTRR